MIINHNMQAMNAGRQMGINQTNSSKNMEKLSSGLRINRAGDDAAGLSISEKMRGQIKGLNQASRNSQDGISLIQTAEGALDETHSILQRMRELAVQGANDTNVAEDRTAITEELNQLTKELDRISDTTEFNKQNLLGGGFEGTFQIGANQGQTIDLKIGDMGSDALGLASGIKFNQVDGVAKDKLAEGNYTIEGTKVTDGRGNEVGKIDATKGEITLADGTTKVALGHATANGGTFTVNSTGDVNLTIKPAANAAGLAAGDYKISGQNIMNGSEVVGKLDAAGKADAVTLNDGTKLNLTTTYGLADTDVADGGTFTVKGINVDNAKEATGSITTIENAISKVSEQRSKLGATQNRLEHTIKNLDNASENTQAAESRIRDVDMAKEMMEMSKNDILNQASQAMLAQAKQAPQAVLQLLR